jgi:hypothetical protein
MILSAATALRLLAEQATYDLLSSLNNPITAGVSGSDAVRMLELGMVEAIGSMNRIRKFRLMCEESNARAAAAPQSHESSSSGRSSASVTVYRKYLEVERTDEAGRPWCWSHTGLRKMEFPAEVPRRVAQVVLVG